MSSSLHPIEQKILATLAPAGSMPFDTLVGKTALNQDQVRRALQWLSTKGLVSVDEEVEGHLEVVRRPPEIDLFLKVAGSSEPIPLGRLKAGFSPDEFSAAFGRARSAGWVMVVGEPEPVVRAGDSRGPDDLGSLLEAISAGKGEGALSQEQASLVPDLLKRGVLRRVENRSTTVSITDAG